MVAIDDDNGRSLPMRALLLALTLSLAACVDVDTAPAAGQAAKPAGGYTLEVRAADGVATYLVRGPDGRSAAARSAEGRSALLDVDAVASLGEFRAAEEASPEVVNLRMPGFSLRVNANEEAGDNGAVAISIGSGGGQRVEVNAQDGGADDAADRAHVLVTGVDEAAARDFIVKADTLSPEVQAQMLAQLGLH